ncbi:hypothetical protein PCANC_04434 [Puccinia coronata f. sp. avenae]|uniref:Uncharacterized protein n=1 Tax=Puccinia coronata f. sp. avenae TaxID=200324 RepID=A0A2N5VUW4_9BASI|nr:hypothetical protein PCANC_04434 [Puccinia coronata f. sp. avenae]
MTYSTSPTAPLFQISTHRHHPSSHSYLPKPQCKVTIHNLLPLLHHQMNPALAIQDAPTSQISSQNQNKKNWLHHSCCRAIKAPKFSAFFKMNIIFPCHPALSPAGVNNGDFKSVTFRQHPNCPLPSMHQFYPRINKGSQ